MSRLILVTGGAGFIGSHLVDALLSRGDRVRVLDDFSTGRRENLAHCLGDIELLEGDVRDPDLALRAVAGCDGVLHEAAVASVARSLEDPEGTSSVTFGGTANVITRARRADVGAFILASSCAVYGDSTELPLPESAETRPRSPYAEAKLDAERACRGQTSGEPHATSSPSGTASVAVPRTLRTVCLRYFNVYGPRQDPSSEYSGVIARFLSVAARRAAMGDEGPPYVVHGDGLQSRDFVFVADVVQANLLAIDACLATRRDDGETAGRALGGVGDGEAVNVGTGRAVRVLDVVAEAQRVGGGRGPAPISWRPPRDADIRASLGDISLARRLFGYEPMVRFPEGIDQTYAWYLDQVGSS